MRSNKKKGIEKKFNSKNLELKIVNNINERNCKITELRKYEIGIEPKKSKSFILFEKKIYEFPDKLSACSRKL